MSLPFSGMFYRDLHQSQASGVRNGVEDELDSVEIAGIQLVNAWLEEVVSSDIPR
jgi:hypothetical protein